MPPKSHRRMFTSGIPKPTCARLTALFVLTLVVLAPVTSIVASPYAISITNETVNDTYGVSLSGQYPTMCVSVDTLGGPHLYASSFEFLIAHDLTGLSFIKAQPGTGFPSDWEYFSYRAYDPDSTCSGCSSGAVRLIGIANVAREGSSRTIGSELAGCIVELTYYTGTDCYLNGSCFHIDFHSATCGDNVVSSATGDTIFTPLSGVTIGPDYDHDSCQAILSDKQTAEPAIAFTNGALCISDPPDDRGDLNLNCIENEIGDAVLYSNYFIYGDSVWDPTWYEVQIYGSDINNDGRTLTIADLVYMIWLIGGHSYYYPTPPTTLSTLPSAEVGIQSVRENNEIRVQTHCPVGIDGIHLVYQYAGCRPGEPVASLPPGIVMGSSARNGELRIAIYPDLENPGVGYPPGESYILSIPIEGSGTLELVETQFSDPDGQVLEAKIGGANVPDRFTLSQNFPNPFNAATVIPYSLRDDAWVTLEIVDILGRTVARPVDEFQSAGSHKYEWRGVDPDGNSVASGMYFYRLSVGDRVMTKKMVLLK